VCFGIEGRKLIAERQLVAMLLNQVADVLADEGDRESRAGHRVAVRPRGRVRIDLERFVVARDHDDVTERMRCTGHFARMQS
jgi:hypothetical protein